MASALLSTCDGGGGVGACGVVCPGVTDWKAKSMRRRNFNGLALDI
jgi:hypothetical protein